MAGCALYGTGRNMTGIHIEVGQSWERFDIDGKLIPLTDDEMAKGAHIGPRGETYVPQIQNCIGGRQVRTYIMARNKTRNGCTVQVAT